ncbi:MAG: exodeoxyribonuclease VII large subunit [Propionibacteriaceae bacterium]|nr:exodeoxyribonuclease VII large subunit [Propionibacteriaceae bacterium]
MALQSSPESPQPLRVIVGATKDWVERLSPVWVEGQLIEIKRRAGATQFLTLRDKLAEVSVRLSTSAMVLDQAGPLAEGTVVAAWVKPTVWLSSGQLTFECRELRPSGEGRLLAAIEQRKRMLQTEGLFASERKRRLPFLPRRIGLVTGADSAAERDVLENAARRWPAVQFEIRHAAVQGPAAVEQLLDGLRVLEQHPEVDVIIVARGGGSLEDLLPFSDEALVRAVFAMRTPVVSAIGHESDNPILDLVADLRASTPTDAAKRVVPDVAAELAGIAQARARAQQAIINRIGQEQRRLAELRSRPVLRDPAASLMAHDERLALLRGRLHRAATSAVRDEARQVEHLISRIRAMSPRATLQRGYAIVSRGDETIASITQTAPGEALTVQFVDGRIGVDVVEVQEAG